MARGRFEGGFWAGRCLFVALCGEGGIFGYGLLFGGFLSGSIIPAVLCCGAFYLPLHGPSGPAGRAWVGVCRFLGGGLGLGLVVISGPGWALSCLFFGPFVARCRGPFVVFGPPSPVMVLG